MTSTDFVLLSKTVSHALRHSPEEYGLTLDPEGWTPVQDLLAALQRRGKWKNVGEQDLHEIIRTSSKRRFEIESGRIRALYGHSTEDRIEHAPAEPPAILYHGTAPEAAAKILHEGLKSMGRHYVHLSSDRATAIEVGRRKAKHPVLLLIQAEMASKAGVLFYEGNDKVWMADFVPPQFIARDGSEPEAGRNRHG